MGVYYCAGVMNYLKDKYTECKKGIEEELTQQVQVLIINTAAMGLMALIGQAAVLVVFAHSAISIALGSKESLVLARLA